MAPKILAPNNPNWKTLQLRSSIIQRHHNRWLEQWNLTKNNSNPQKYLGRGIESQTEINQSYLRRSLWPTFRKIALGSKGFSSIVSALPWRLSDFPASFPQRDVVRNHYLSQGNRAVGVWRQKLLHFLGKARRTTPIPTWRLVKFSSAKLCWHPVLYKNNQEKGETGKSFELVISISSFSLP